MIGLRELWDLLREKLARERLERVPVPWRLRRKWRHFRALTRDAAKDADAARRLVEEGEAQLATLGEVDRRIRGSLLHMLGHAYRTVSGVDPVIKLRNAARCLKEAAECFADTKSPRRVIEIHRELGDVWMDLPDQSLRRRLTRAVESYNEALRIADPKTMPRAYASLRHSVGVMMLRPMFGTASRIDALKSFLQALQYQHPKRDPVGWATTMVSLGGYYVRFHQSGMTDLEHADECLRDALPVLQRRGLRRLAATARYYRGQALAAAEREKGLLTMFASPESEFRAALEIFTRHAYPNEFRAVQDAVGDLWFARRDWEKAIGAYEEAIAAGEQLYRSGRTTEGRASQLAENASLYLNAAFSLARLGRPTEGFAMLERGKARHIVSALRLRMERPEGVPEETWRRFESAAAALRGFRVPERADGKSMFRVEQQAAALSAAFETAVGEVRRHATAFDEPLRPEELVETLAGPRRAVVALCVTTQGTAAFVLHPSFGNEPQVVMIATFGESQITDLLVHDDPQERQKERGFVIDYDAFLEEPGEKRFGRWLESFDAATATLGRELLAPIVAVLPAEVRELLILPSSRLYLLPLHAAPLPDTGELLGHRYVVHYAPSADVALRRRGRTQTAAPAFYAVSNPAADATLALADIECEHAAAAFPRAEVDRGRTATPSRVLRRLPGATHVHFACHGEYDRYEPAESCLLLAGGRLTMAELTSPEIDLANVRLVVLSACETGISDVLRGSPQEYVGIPAAFMIAGAACVVSSLWSVPDAATGLLMQAFYDAYTSDGLPAAEALARAQAWVRTLSPADAATLLEHHLEKAADRGAAARLFKEIRYLRQTPASDPPFAHPYFWAAFVVTG